jgi:hypothetical protein
MSVYGYSIHEPVQNGPDKGGVKIAIPKVTAVTIVVRIAL